MLGDPRGWGSPHPLRLYIGAFRPSNYCSLERSYISWQLGARFAIQLRLRNTIAILIPMKRSPLSPLWGGVFLEAHDSKSFRTTRGLRWLSNLTFGAHNTTSFLPTVLYNKHSTLTNRKLTIRRACHHEKPSDDAGIYHPSLSRNTFDSTSLEDTTFKHIDRTRARY
jgi:hypothetical protein